MKISPLILGAFALLPFVTVAQASTRDLKTYLAPALPPRLAKIIPGKTRAAEVESILGSARKRTPTELFFVLAGHEFDTGIGIRDGVVRYVYHSPEPSSIGPQFTLSRMKSFFTARELSQAEKAAARERTTHEGGRYLTVRVAEQGLRLKFQQATDDQKLVSVLIESASKASR